MNLTEEQQAIINEVAGGRDNLVVNAVAGSGKTTILTKAATAWQDRFPTASGFACAFNKEIAETLKSRLPSQFNVSTLHSCGFSAWKQWLGKTSKVDKYKDYNCLEAVIGPQLWGDEEVLAIKQDLRRGLSLLKSQVMNQDEEVLERNRHDVVENLKDHFLLHGLNFADEDQEIWAAGKIVDALEESIRQATDLGLVSFDDMLFMPVYVNASFPQHDLVMLDEAQDVSPLQLEMVTRSVKPRGKLIAVGDRNQAIYGWRGAMSDSIERISKEFDCIELPMTFSFRCPQAVIEEAQRVVPHIRCPETASAGLVQRIGLEKLTNALVATPKSAIPNCAIVCRNRKPLIEMAFSLRRSGVKAFVLGSEIANILTNMVRSWSINTVIQVEEEAVKWKDQKLVELRARKAYGQMQEIEDRADALISICENLPADSNKRKVIEEIQGLFANERKSGEAFLLCTIHKAKGLEWPTVFFLMPELIPNKYATKEWQLQQEENLRYVSVTRSLERLFFVSASYDEEESPDGSEDNSTQSEG